MPFLPEDSEPKIVGDNKSSNDGSDDDGDEEIADSVIGTKVTSFESKLSSDQVLRKLLGPSIGKVRLAKEECMFGSAEFSRIRFPTVGYLSDLR